MDANFTKFITDERIINMTNTERLSYINKFYSFLASIIKEAT